MDQIKISADFDKQIASIDGRNISAVMFIFGTGPDIENVKKVCVRRAQADNDFNVAWCPDSTVLSAPQLARFFVPGKAAVAVGPAKTVAASLTSDEGQSAFAVDEAFIDASLQTP